MLGAAPEFARPPPVAAPVARFATNVQLRIWAEVPDPTQTPPPELLPVALLL
jgi:hypothetical protein